jgi:quinol monooxygenase YgiN
VAKRLTIFEIPGDPEELLEAKHRTMDSVMSKKGPEYGHLVHVAARKPDGSGILIVNVWNDAEGSDRAFQDPEMQEARAKMGEIVESARGGATHYEVVDFRRT